jgi:hypothetical protein
MGEEPAGNAGPEGPEEKGDHLGAPGVDGHGIGGGFVVAHGVERLARVERTKLLMIQMQAAAQAKTVGRLAQLGWLPRPRGPPMNSRFSIMLLTMNMKAREMMAR